MVWTDAHDEYLLREILTVEPYKFKYGSPKRGESWSQIAEILNDVQDPVFRVNQRAVRDRYGTLEKVFKKKMADEEKASGISPPDLTDFEIALQEIIEKFQDVALQTNENNDSERKKAEEVRQSSLETFAETRKRRDTGSDDDSPKPTKRRATGSETINFLRLKAENDSELRKEELRVRENEIKTQQKNDANSAKSTN